MYRTTIIWSLRTAVAILLAAVGRKCVCNYKNIKYILLNERASQGCVTLVGLENRHIHEIVMKEKINIMLWNFC